VAENLARECGGSSGFVQILVIVANIQTRVYCQKLPCKGNKALKTVVEKVSLSSANVQGLAGPKERAYELKYIHSTESLSPKGKHANIHVHYDGCVY